MMRRGRVRPSKSSSLLGAAVGCVMVVIGFTAVMHFGTFGIIWLLVAAAITLFHVYNLISDRGASYYEVDIEERGGDPIPKPNVDFDERLRKLETLRREGLITEQEYAVKREQIMNQRW